MVFARGCSVSRSIFDFRFDSSFRASFCFVFSFFFVSRSCCFVLTRFFYSRFSVLVFFLVLSLRRFFVLAFFPFRVRVCFLRFCLDARLVMQPPDAAGSGRRPAVVDNAASATDMPELRKHEEVVREKVETMFLLFRLLFRMLFRFFVSFLYFVPCFDSCFDSVFRFLSVVFVSCSHFLCSFLVSCILFFVSFFPFVFSLN